MQKKILMRSMLKIFKISEEALLDFDVQITSGNDNNHKKIWVFYSALTQSEMDLKQFDLLDINKRKRIHFDEAKVLQNYNRYIILVGRFEIICKVYYYNNI